MRDVILNQRRLIVTTTNDEMIRLQEVAQEESIRNFFNSQKKDDTGPLIMIWKSSITHESENIVRGQYECKLKKKKRQLQDREKVFNTK